MCRSIVGSERIDYGKQRSVSKTGEGSSALGIAFFFKQKPDGPGNLRAQYSLQSVIYNENAVYIKTIIRVVPMGDNARYAIQVCQRGSYFE